MKKFFIFCLMAFVMCSCVNYAKQPTSEMLQKQARIEIFVNEDLTQYEHLVKWKKYSDFFDMGYGRNKQTFPYNLELGKTYYRYRNNKLEPFIINWLSFNGDEVWCSVTIDGKTKIIDGFFNDYSQGSYTNENYYGNYPIFQTIDDCGNWIESGNQQYVIPCGTLGNFITTYRSLTFSESNCYLRKEYADDWCDNIGVYPSYSFDNGKVVCHQTDIRYVYYKDSKIHIVCNRKYSSEEECRKGTLGEMGLMK